ncbi:TetR/AcrR family transcriptional regulator [Nocardia salmonicida]|uniref:TetR/AcrR family transcriptional regulator n=1 Tax=Nocardia salmonicida TaxID=53431 RepID=UPI00366D3EFF
MKPQRKESVYPPIADPYPSGDSSATSTDTTPRMRADAARNLQRILTVARELLAARGTEITLDDVARHAGLGTGTVYRRFANKQDLIAHIFEQDLAEFAAEAVAASNDTIPWQGILRIVDYASERVVTNRGFSELLRRTPSDPVLVRYAREEIAPAISRLLDHARAEGSVRPGVGVSDIFAIITSLNSVAPVVDYPNPQCWRRFLSLAMDGIRSDTAARTPLEPPEAYPLSIRDEAGPATHVTLAFSGRPAPGTWRARLNNDS